MVSKDWLLRHHRTKVVETDRPSPNGTVACPLLYPHVLTMAGSDAPGGAGVQSDLRTFGRLGVAGRSVIAPRKARRILARGLGSSSFVI
jgi:hypothetical protein